MLKMGVSSLIRPTRAQPIKRKQQDELSLFHECKYYTLNGLMGSWIHIRKQWLVGSLNLSSLLCCPQFVVLYFPPLKIMFGIGPFPSFFDFCFLFVYNTSCMRPFYYAGSFLRILLKCNRLGPSSQRGSNWVNSYN